MRPAAGSAALWGILALAGLLAFKAQRAKQRPAGKGLTQSRVKGLSADGAKHPVDHGAFSFSKMDSWSVCARFRRSMQGIFFAARQFTDAGMLGGLEVVLSGHLFSFSVKSEGK